MAKAAVTMKNLLSQAELAALGAVVAESAQLEDTINVVIMTITHQNQAQFDILVGAQMIGRKLTILKELGLLKLRSKRKQKEFSQLIDDLSASNGQRAIAVHGLWGPTGGLTMNLLFALIVGNSTKARLPPAEAVYKRGKGRESRIKAERLDELATRIADGKSDLFRFWKVNWVRGRR